MCRYYWDGNHFNIQNFSEERCQAIHLRSIQDEEYTLDIQFRKTRDHQASYIFMQRLVKAFGEPTVLTTDKAPALICAFKKLEKNGFYAHTEHHCTIKHLNNRMEQDHRYVKRRFSQSSGFQSIRHASRTIKGIEIIQAVYKQRRSLSSDFVFSAYKELQPLFKPASILHIKLGLFCLFKNFATDPFYISVHIIFQIL